MCDFRQYYGVDVPATPDEGCDLARLSVLWTGLPSESRTARRINPENEWGPEAYLLRSIERWAHLIWWSKTKDARHRRREPKPVETPGEAAEARRRAERAEESRDLVARQLGYEGL